MKSIINVFRHYICFLCCGALIPIGVVLAEIDIDRSNVEGDVVGRDKITVMPQKQKNLLEKTVGNWELSSYMEHTQPNMAPFFEINEGTLSIDQRGVAVWTVIVKDKYGSFKYGPLKITSTGQISPTGIIKEKRGGEYNTTHHMGPWQLDMQRTELTVRGWAIGKPSDPFTISVDGKLLEMTNYRCTLTWFRK